MKTSSLTSTKPPTAVSMPSASSPILELSLDASEGLHGALQRCGIRLPGEQHIDQPCFRPPGAAHLLPCALQLFACLVAHFAGVDGGHLSVVRQLFDAAPLRGDRSRTLHCLQLRMRAAACEG